MCCLSIAKPKERKLSTDNNEATAWNGVMSGGNAPCVEKPIGITGQLQKVSTWVQGGVIAGAYILGEYTGAKKANSIKK